MRARVIKVFKYCLLIFILTIYLGKGQTQNNLFKEEQLKNNKIKSAYDQHQASIHKSLKKLKINPSNFDVLIRSFKIEKQLDIWVRNHDQGKFTFYKSYPICSTSGKPGPKRKEGDKQVPEGFYEIKSFSVSHKYHLGMLISYPNKSDKIKGKKPVGSDIMIHGKCETSGCMPMTDEIMNEIYVISLESFSAGNKILVESYPCKMDTGNVSALLKRYGGRNRKLWKQLSEGYDYFEKNKMPAKFRIDGRGNYIFKED